MAKRSTPSTRKPAKKKTAVAAKKAPAKKASAAKGAAAKKAPARKAPVSKASSAAKGAAAKKGPAKKAAAKKVSASAAAKGAAAKKAPARKEPPPARAAAPARKAAPAKKKKAGPARRAADAVKSAARKVAAVVGAPVKAVAAVVAGPVVEPPPDAFLPSGDDDEHDGSSNGVDARPDDDDDGDQAESAQQGADPAVLLGQIESAYGVSLPERYRRFLREGEYQRYPRIELAGYIRGPYDLDFVDELLADVSELGQNAGIYDMDDVPWSDDYAGYVPLASLSHPEVDEPKVFLVHQVAGDQHRVLLFDYEGWRLYPLADSFESFLAGLPRATNDIATAFRPGA